MLYQLPEGSWVDPAKVASITTVPGKKLQRSGAVINKPTVFVTIGDTSLSMQYATDEEAARIRDVLATAVNEALRAIG